MTDHEQRIQKLERWCLHLEASSTMQMQAVGSLLALLEDCAAVPELRRIQPHQIRATYNQLLRRGVEDYLRMQADHDPTLASQLRGMLQQQLDGPPPPQSA